MMPFIQTAPAAAGSSGGITTIASGSLPAAATLDITDIPATYAYLVLYLAGVSSGTNTRQVLVQVDSDNGASFDTTASNYLGFIVDNAAAVSAHSLASLVEGATVAASVAVDVLVVIKGYQGGPTLHADYLVRQTTGAIHHAGQTIYLGTTSAINAIRILWSNTGNFDAGTYALYGVS